MSVTLGVIDEKPLRPGIAFKPFSNHLPRRQCSPLDRLRLLSMGAGTPMSIMTFSQSVVTDPRTNNEQ
ncbi:hypothetical protein TNCV_2917811 [Trichonephila clavipes]|nr:hypothetical protein TNCV_2917811 [Trichonephila clavipes]